MPQTTTPEPQSITEAAEAARNELVPTSVSEWGKKKSADDGFTCELPSGNIVKMRRTLDLPMLLSTGRIPNPLAGIVSQMMKEGTGQFPAESMQDMRAVKQLMNLLDATVQNCVIEPPVSRPDPQNHDESDEDYTARLEVWKPEPNTLSVFDIEVQDKMFIFAVAQGGAADLTRFREEQAAAMGDVPPGENVPKPTKRTGGTANRQQRRTAAKKK